MYTYTHRYTWIDVIERRSPHIQIDGALRIQDVVLDFGHGGHGECHQLRGLRVLARRVEMN